MVKENIENLNEVAHNRPRANLVLGNYILISYTYNYHKSESFELFEINWNPFWRCMCSVYIHM